MATSEKTTKTSVKKTTSTAKTTTRKTAAKKTTAKAAKAVEVVEPVVETKVEVKKFENTDLIPCICMFPGSVGMTGRRTGNVYIWEDMGAVEYVEYQDLKSEVLNKRSTYIYEPLIIVDDEDFLAQNQALADIYETFYTPDEIIDKIINSKPEAMKKFILALPSGLKQSVKNIAATLIKDGDLDSVRKINAIDDIFGTELIMFTQED